MKAISFLQQRLSELNITPQQNEISVFDSVEGIFHKSVFFTSDKDDNIVINYFDPAGNVEKHDKKGKLKNFFRTRLKEPNGHGKYTQPFNSSVIPFVTPSIIEKVKSKFVIDTLVITEGEFKAFSGSINGIDTIGIGGIYNFKNKGENKLHDYFYTIIEACQVKKIVLLFDADVFALKYKPDTDLYLWRNSFYCAVRNFKLLTECFNVDVYFSHIKTSFNDTAKGLDDLINHADTDINILKSELFNLTVSNDNRKYIDCFCISANGILKLREYFALNNVTEFYNKYADTIGVNDFIFHGKTYEIIEDNPVYKMSNDNKFWFVKTGGTVEKPKYTLHIDSLNFAKFLQSKGFCRIYVGKYPMLIRIENNIVDEVTNHVIRDFVKDYVRNLPNIIETEPVEFNKTQLETCLISANNIYFSDYTLSWIDAIKLKTKRDTKNESFIYFQNCYVKITKEDFEYFDYSELKKPIWRKQIIDREFHYIKPDYCEFEKFILNICRQNLDRYNALISTIGYLMHRYKDPANAKLIVYTDERISAKGKANGRSGKSLVMTAIRKFKNVLFKGKTFDPLKAFAWEGMGLDIDIILIDDAPIKFDINPLFTNITGDFTMEGKRDKEIIIPYAESPKIAVSLNYTLKGDDEDSVKDRIIKCEFSDYYNINNKPDKEFGHRLFDDWNDNQWQQFNLFMINAIMYYLENGLKEVKGNYEMRSLIETVSEPFMEFMNNLEHGKEFSTNDLLSDFLIIDKKNLCRHDY